MEARGKIDCWDSGSSPSSQAETATPASVWVCSTHCASGRAAWTALWMVNPAGFTANGVSRTARPSASTFTRLEAVISSKNAP